MGDVSGSRGGRGRLAQVIATRGGKAAPEAPFVIEHREALIYMLCEGAELEHGIMCQYLYAAFSLKQTEDEGLSKEEVEAVTRWRTVISHVAAEEMLHLALVHNVLSAVGSAPHLARPNLPAPAHHYPAGVQLALRPFGEEALRHFMFLERPEGMQLNDPREFAAAIEESEPAMADGEIVPRLQDFATVGHLYRSIEEGLAHLAEKFGEQGLFVGPARAQATSANFSWPELVAVTDLRSAQQALDTILEQGEGARGDWRHAHFGQFVEILDEYRQMREANPDFDPVRPVLGAKVRPGEHGDALPLITDPISARCVDLFNVSYEVLLQALERYFAHTEETDDQLATLANATWGVMLRVLKPLGNLLTTLPVGPAHPGLTAAATFELFYESDYLMPHREAAWALLEERLREAAAFAHQIEADAGEPLAAALSPISQALSEVADSLAAHFADWGGASRFAAESPREPVSDTGELEAWLRRADELAAALAAVESTPGAVGAVETLFGEAHQLLLAAALPAGDAGAEDPQASRFVAPLVKSVLRPLAAAVGASAQAGQPRPSQAETAATNGKTGKKHDAEQTVPERLWALAQTATELRIALDAEPGLVPALAEATACLQALALASAPDREPDSAATRLARLAELQAPLRRVIQSAARGPYLVTNAATMRNWLGEEIPTRPQMALCRCGASSTKPFCDGTHAEIGFNDEKDPNRVPDQLDTYVGQQVTVLDNRGTCQHSGFCTDRLPAAFRVDGDPFVAPSGGRMDEIMRAVRDCPSGALSFAIGGREARDQVDWNGLREPAIEVSKDGPYRITGPIPLTGASGEGQARNAGASLEHYALCRCGHSQNKPFCSGMHWYVEFRDPVPDPERTPTPFEWCGGLPALTRMTQLFYQRYVPEDPLLAPLFANMSPDHPERVARWLGEVLGGPPEYSEQYGGYKRMISQHLGKALTEEQRARWVSLICHSAQEAGLPSDPEWHAAFNSYLEWGSRLAVENSQPGATPPGEMPMPHWDWGTAGAPGSRISALAEPTDADESPAVLPGPDEPVSYQKHIKTLFRQRDRQSMKFVFDLWSYADVKQHGDAILERLRDGSMPCDGAWPGEKVDVFQRWADSGMPA